jgi:NADPH-dependent 2,4-dienoyl-CoA reductase/sulfur reductase-like enzyme
MSAASAARRVDPGLDIVVLEATGYAAYGMCGLPYYVAGLVDRPEDLLAYPPEYFREKRRIDLRLHARVFAVEADRGMVRYTQDGRTLRLSYDHLVVTTGGTPVVPSIPGIDAECVFTIRTLEDAIALRNLLDAGRIGRALIVGGGYIGLEMADALRAHGCSVVLAEVLPQVMANYDAPIAALVEAEVRRHGVDLRLDTLFEEVIPSPAGVQVVVGGETVTVDAMILALGVRANAGHLAAAGAATGPGGGLLVDDRMRTTLPGILAAGDCIAAPHLVLGRPAFVPLGPAANKTGRVAGTVAAGGDSTFRGIVGTAVVKVFDLCVGRTGLTLAEAQAEDLDAVATDVVGKSCAKYYPGSTPVTVRLVHEARGRLLGCQMLGTSGVAKRLDVVATALHAGFDIDDLAALDLSYAPPYAPVYDPILLAAQAAVRAPGAAASVA